MTGRSFPRTVGLAAGLAAGALYGRAMVRRNEALRPEPILGADGSPLPVRKVVFSDGTRVELIDTGSAGEARGDRGPTFLLVPGADGVKESFRHQILPFARVGRVVCPDLRSSFPPHATFDRLVRDLVEIVEELETGPVVLLGQSLGGAIAMRFSVDHSHLVRALVLCNTLARVTYSHLGPDRSLLTPPAMLSTRYLPTFLGRWLARCVWSPLAAWVYDDSPGSEKVVDYVLQSGPRTVSPRVSGRRVALLREEDLRPELPRIRAPTLVVKGPRDAYCPPAWAREIAALIPGAAYLEIEGTGHCSHVSMPGLFNRAVLGWTRAVLGLAEEGSLGDGPLAEGSLAQGSLAEGSLEGAALGEGPDGEGGRP